MTGQNGVCTECGGTEGPFTVVYRETDTEPIGTICEDCADEPYVEAMYRESVRLDADDEPSAEREVRAMIDCCE